MTRLKFDISISLDGFAAGPDQSLENPLGEGGEQLHEWIFGLESWRASHGKEGGEAGRDSEVAAEIQAGIGAVIMGRGMFGGGEDPWGDGSWRGWWGEDPPFHTPVFVLTHHPREPLEMQGGTTFHFVTDGIESALEQARAAAGDQDISIGGGASVAQQYLKAGLLDEFQVHVVPVLLGDGARLFDDLAGVEVETTRALDSPTGVAHLRYRVVK